MLKRGELFIFEGPDGVGKSTLSAQFAARLEMFDINTVLLSFPGREPGTLGHLIYDLHHAPETFGLQNLSAASLQTLHIAAHLDLIEERILPALTAGKTVILDRFWWSTWVYGLVGSVRPSLLKALLKVEKSQWGRIQPTTAFLVTSDQSWRPEDKDEHWPQLAATYIDLVQQEKSRYPIELIANQSSLEATLEVILNKARTHSSSERFRLLSHIKVESKASESEKPATEKKTLLTPFIKRESPRTTPVFDTYWRFAAERQNIFFRRFAQQKAPWTTDPILQEYKFTNAYRASDRVSQFLIRHVIYRQDEQNERSENNALDGYRARVAQNTISNLTQQRSGMDYPEDMFFRILLFKFFNRISTWRQLEHEFGEISFANYDFDRYSIFLSELRQNQSIFSSAYIMPSGRSHFGGAEKHRNCLRLLERMIEDGVPWRLQELKTMRQAFDLLISYPMLGKFLAYQFVTDLNYSPLTNFSEAEFVMPGPGALDGIAKCFTALNGWDESDVIRWMMDNQEREFQRREIVFQSLWGRPLQLIDCQNLFCEVDKYARVAHPEVLGLSGRTRIKQRFEPAGENTQYWYPPQWGLNEKISSP